MNERVPIETFAALDIRVGTIQSAEPHPDADKLLVLTVSIGEENPRQVVAGIRPFIENPANLVGQRCCVVANLEKKQLRGVTSDGMLLAAGAADTFSFIVPAADVPDGTPLR